MGQDGGWQEIGPRLLPAADRQGLAGKAVIGWGSPAGRERFRGRAPPEKQKIQEVDGIGHVDVSIIIDILRMNI